MQVKYSEFRIAHHALGHDHHTVKSIASTLNHLHLPYSSGGYTTIRSMSAPLYV
jgi:hypothetical protein